VLVAPSGQVIGEGHTQQAGGPHAEIMALRHASDQGYTTEGASAYVTLEPCSHQGRTGPCCDALAAAGIGKVVASIADPNPLVSGNGFIRLRENRIGVEIGSGAVQSRALNIGFFSRMIRKTPWVRTKIAASMDGVTALNNGASKWITSEAARNDGQVWRARACAILTGIGTIRQDDPLLNVRTPHTERQPHLIVVDSRLETPLDAQFWTVERKTFIYTATDDQVKKRELEARGAIVVYMPDISNKVNLKAMLQDLALREINELHVEAGHGLDGS
jgi:diaminohydroxyphosphoribosylaminopyrimidine deaminase/5-amino-6-(5-phosphoribosylamino)uracil reductase